MNIAYLILAHNQPKLLLRLIERLDQPNAHFYVHVDKKSTEIAAIRQCLSKFNNVTVVSINKVYWMGYNMVKSTLDLLELAWNSGINFKYFVLLSGQDYPIKSNAFINSFFESNTNDFISYNKVDYLAEGIKDKVRYYYYMDTGYYNPRSPTKVPRLVYLHYGLHRQYRKFSPSRKFYNGMEPYFGSQWFALTRDTIGYILNFCKEHPGYLKFMKYSEGPDELFFQTILLNSERRKNLCDYDQFMKWLPARKDNDLFSPAYSSLRYMDWSERSGKTKPAMLDTAYLEELRASKDLFARKIDEKQSAELLDKIDAELLK